MAFFPSATNPSEATAPRRAPALALAAVLLAGVAPLTVPAPALASVEQARAAQARGDLRAAQIELRNAVRNKPGDAAVRAALAAVSLDLGDTETAEKEARAALDRGFDPAAGTALVLRSYLARGRARDLLRDFPPREQPAAVGGQIAAGRALALASIGELEEARQMVAEALRLAPGAAEPHLAAATLALQGGDRAAAEAEVDQALAAAPGSHEAMVRKAGLQLQRGDQDGAVATVGRLISAAPGYLPARLFRAEMRIRAGDDAHAREDVDAALRTIPNSIPAIYLRAVLLARAQEWRGADEALQRLGPALPNLPNGLLMQASVKRALGQPEQAIDAAQRHVARYPEDPRGAKLLAAMEAEAGRPEAAAEVLSRLASRGGADAEALDMLGRLQGGTGHRREAVEALQRAAELAPRDAGILARLGAARLVTGDLAGMTEAAQGSLAISPEQPGAREMLATAALARGDLEAAETELGRLDPAARRGEAASVLEGTIRLMRFDLPAARASFEGVLRDHPESIGARLGLARVAMAQDKPAEAERLLGEVLRRNPANAEAIGRLSVTALSGGPGAASSRAALEAAQAAAPGEPTLALALVRIMLQGGEASKAVALLQSEPLRAAYPRSNGGMSLVLAGAQAAAGQWTEAEEASRAALAQNPDSVPARRMLAGFMLRAGDARAAEALIQEGLRSRPGDPQLQNTLLSVVRQARGLDAALEAADQQARKPEARPASLALRGDLLMGAQRFEEAARAYAAAYAEAPSAALALRQAAAWRAARNPAKAVAALEAWLQREPKDPAALGVLAQIDIEAGRLAEAVRRLEDVVARAPNDAVALNNLAWLLADRAGSPERVSRARSLAERAYFLAPAADTADTLGWILARNGEPGRAVPILRQAVAATAATQAPNLGMSYRLAFALRGAGEQEEARRVLETVLSGSANFPERSNAERMLTELRARH